jgi:Tfp pilus assembly protein PilF
MSARTGRNERFDRDLKTAFDALHDHDFEAAQAAIDRCKRIDRNHPDVLGIDAVLSALDGDFERSMESWRKVIELQPENPAPRIAAANLALDDMFDPEAALSLIAPAFEHIEEELDLIAAVCCKASAHTVLASRATESGNLAEADSQKNMARDALGELASSMIEDPDQLIELSYLAIESGAETSAATWINKLAGMSDELKAEAFLLQSRIAERNEDHAAKIAAWQQVRTFDVAMDVPPIAVTDDEIMEIVREAIASLPPTTGLTSLSLNTAKITIATSPSTLDIGSGIDPRELVTYGASDKPHITVFKRNVERISNDEEHFADELYSNVVDSAAKFLGIDLDSQSSMDFFAAQQDEDDSADDDDDDDDDDLPS